MFVVLFLRRLLCLGIFLSLTSTTYLYLYPLFHGCAFPFPNSSPTHSYFSTLKSHLTGHDPAAAPFRLLALGDPQLEGDTALPGHFQRHIQREPRTLPQKLIYPITRDVPRQLFRLRKRIDLWGNDYYLAHIHRTLKWWSSPTHVTVLGDLLGSQWINDEEFSRRARRYWQKVFPRGHRVEDEITSNSTTEILGADPRWQTRIINIAGNHDVGYSGDMTRARVDRFERAFGKHNWNIRFQHCPSPDDCPSDAPEIRLIILDSMNLDSPVLDNDLQDETYAFLNHIISTSRDVQDKATFTVLLTHVPLHKKAGVCVDGPMVEYNHPAYGNGGVREQNHLTQHAGSDVILAGIFGMNVWPEAVGGGRGRPGVILNGHDHEGCDVYHHLVEAVEQSSEPGDEADESATQANKDDEPKAKLPREWDATPYPSASALLDNGLPGIREITVRSMMGDFAGNAGLLSAWYEEDKGAWKVEFGNCRAGTQHVWWGAHITVLITLFVGVVYGVVLWMTARESQGKRGAGEKKSLGDGTAAGHKGEGKATGRDRGTGSTEGGVKKRPKQKGIS